MAKRVRAKENLAEFVVTVVDETGAPIVGALITYAAENAVLPEMAFRTDAKGRSTIDLPPGGVQAFVHYDGAAASVSGQLPMAGLELRVVMPN